jgi:ketosteroid isomerase-like protein
MRRLGMLTLRGSHTRSLVAIVVLTTACESKGSSPESHAADEAAVRAADIAWSATAEKRDLDALVSFYGDDVVVLLPNAPAVVGKSAARDLNRAMLAATLAVKWQPVKVEVAASGDIGYVRGTYDLTIKGPSGAPVNDKGKYVEVWRKQADGAWKVIVEALNSDLPAAASPPAAKK